MSIFFSEWTASQGDRLMTDSQNDDLLSAARRADQQGGNQLFEINPERLHRPRSWQRGTVVQMAVRFQLEQLRPANGEVLEEAISEEFMQGLRQFIRSQNIQPVEEYSMSFQIHHNTGTHMWTSSPVMPLTEWLQGSERSRAWLEQTSAPSEMDDLVTVRTDCRFHLPSTMQFIGPSNCGKTTLLIAMLKNPDRFFQTQNGKKLKPLFSVIIPLFKIYFTNCKEKVQRKLNL